MESNENACGLVFNFDLIVPLGLYDFNIRRIFILDAQELALDSDFVPVVDAAYIETFEVADSLYETHPE